MNDLMQKLMVSKQIMDRHNEMDNGISPKKSTQQQLVREYNETPVNASYNIPEEYLSAASQTPKVSPAVMTEDRIKNSKLPDSIKRLMMEHPIQQAQQYQTTISDDIIEKAARLMGNNKQSVSESIPQQTKPQNERNELRLIERLQFVANNPFKRITYTEAIDLLLNSSHYKKKKFKFDVAWGTDLQSEHERFLVEKEFKSPVIITDYPASFKAFYMRQNEDGKTVAAMDVLFPGIGEIVGGSQREERLDILKEKCKAFNIHEEELWWYLDTRKFGSVPHAGFGLGFERMIMFVTGMTNIRDVIPFPRTPQNAEF
jgi:aspartyl/asparaginyl-tRNA synthetase